MQKAISPIVGSISAISTEYTLSLQEKAVDIVESVSAAPQISWDIVVYYLFIGFIGALGGWVFKMIVKFITNKIKTCYGKLREGNTDYF